jgi:serine-type D-Ala-D-Ala carboxypeptidase/endopeptidase (penicillin-binding protein 4)
MIEKALSGSTAKHADFEVVGSPAGPITSGALVPSAPASNEKILTTGTILVMLGPTFRYTTRVGAATTVTKGTLHGDLDLIGSGDPTLTTTNLARMASNLHRKGLRHVTGRLVVDDSRYSHVTLARGWKRAFVPAESGPLSAFTVNHNGWRGGRAFDRDPTPDNAALWRKALHKAHITIHGKTRVGAIASMPVTLQTHRSEDLDQIVRDTLTYSINFDAEMMLREIGAQRSGHGTLASGVAGVRAEATTLGLPVGTIYDGSGLSYDDRETPATLVAWLAKLYQLTNVAPSVYYGMPVACHTGTLRNRLCGKYTSGHVRAKTGTLDHVTALSGFATAKSGRTLMFSFLLSGFKKKNFGKAIGHLDDAVAVAVRNG